MFKKVMGLIAGFLVLMFFVTLFQVKAGTKTTAKELEDKVIVYTTYDKEVTDIIKTEFEKSTSINVEITKFSSDDDMVNALKTKKDVVPDVILGASTETYETLKKDNLLDSNKPSWYYDVSEDQKDKNGYWYSLFGSPIVMFYNTSMVKAEEVPQNILALSDKKYANLLVMPNVDSMDFKYFLNTAIAPYVKDNKVDDGFKAISALKFNIKSYKTPGDAVIQAVSKKEGAIGFAELSKVNDTIKKGSTLAVVYGSEKYPMIADGIAIVKDCADINAAKLFEEFAAGPKMQYKIAQKFKMNPTNSKALDLCGGIVSELKDRTYEIDTNSFNTNISSWIAKWNAITKEETPVDNKNKENGEGVNSNNAAVQVNGSNTDTNNTTTQNNDNNAEKQPASNATTPAKQNTNNNTATGNSSKTNSNTTKPAATTENKQQSGGNTQNNTGTSTGASSGTNTGTNNTSGSKTGTEKTATNNKQ